jgi:stage III sporulation protein AE
MGAIAFIFAILFIALVMVVVYAIRNEQNRLIPLGLTLALAVFNGMIGFFDDYCKLLKKQNEGLKAWQKFGLQVIAAIAYVVLLELFGAEAGATCKLLILIMGVLIISAVLSVVGEQSENKTLSAVMRFCSVGALFSSVGYVFYLHFEALEDFFARISVFVNGMIPVTASIWALGGNVSTATAGSATLYCFLTVFEKLWAASAIPVFSLILILGLCDVLCSELKTVRVLGTVKKIYGFFLGLSMTVLLSSLAAQTTLTAVADSVSARAGRLVSSTVIPIVGGNLGEALRTVASSVSYLKNIFGVGGIIIIALIVLPMAISLLLTRFVFGICSAFADIIGCEREAKLLAAFSDAYGCMLAVVCGVGMMFVLSLCIFMKTVVAAA